jgi:hypothetical protein
MANNRWADPNKDEGDLRRAVRFVVVTIGALVVGYLVAVLLYAKVIPTLIGATG